MKTCQIVTVGDLTADIVTTFPSFPIQEGDFIPAGELYLEVGGNANFLIAAARLGGKALALGSVGDDFWGHQVAEILREEGINLEFLAASGTTTVVQVLVDEGGRHTFLGKYGSGPALVFDDRTRQAIQGSEALFCSGYSFAEGRMREYTLESLRAAREGGVPIYFDVGPASFELEEDLKRKILEGAKVVLLTEEELPAVGDGEISGILELGPELVILKKGAGGSELHSVDGKAFSASGYPVEVVDTTAAGDSFAAGFITARCWGWDLEKCAAFANAVGAAKARKMGGGRNVPTLEEVQGVLKEFKVGIVI